MLLYSVIRLLWTPLVHVFSVGNEVGVTATLGE
jgi:hypothetical protein